MFKLFNQPTLNIRNLLILYFSYVQLHDNGSF